MGKVQVIISTMNRKMSDIPTLLENMNIQTDCIVVNQCPTSSGQTSTVSLKVNGNSCEFVTNNMNGIGKSRNEGLLHIDGDIILFADDDIRYMNGYEEMVLAAFKNHPDTDAIVFNTTDLGRVKEDTSKMEVIKPEHLKEGNEEYRCADKYIARDSIVKWYNCLRYGGVRLAVKKSFLDEHNVWFTLEHGGGTKYGFGEDTIFIHDLIVEKAKIYAVPQTLCEYDYNDSSWFKGYDEKFFFDQGVLFKKLYRTHHKLMGFLFITLMVLKSKDKLTKLSKKNAVKSAWKGYLHQ